jgi:prolyl-tRNA editing enzyme YbaK/EbsC (Cys-tRNA(Pro) deacylase)
VSKGGGIYLSAIGLFRLFNREVKTHSVGSTAGGVLKSIEDAKKGVYSAGLASKEICSFYPELNVLAENVQDDKINETRFLILVRKEFDLIKNGDRTWYIFRSNQKNKFLSRVLSKANKWGVIPIELHSVLLDPFKSEMAYFLEVEGNSQSHKLSFFRDESGISELNQIGCGYSSLCNWKRDFNSATISLQSIKKRNDYLTPFLSSCVQKNIKKIDKCNELLLVQHNPVSSVESVWATLGISGEDILKTMILYNKDEPKSIVCCCLRGSDKIDYKKINKICNGFFKRATMKILDSKELTIGAISPMSVPDGCQVLIDEAVFERNKIFMGSNSTDISIVLPSKSLLLLKNTSQVDIKLI